MINFNTPYEKWRNESPFSASTAYIEDYSRHFKVAVQNLEMNLQEERLKRIKRRLKK